MAVGKATSALHCLRSCSLGYIVEVPIGTLIAYADQGIARELLIMC
jgi:hypothetical protein